MRLRNKDDDGVASDQRPLQEGGIIIFGGRLARQLPERLNSLVVGVGLVRGGLAVELVDLVAVGLVS